MDVLNRYKITSEDYFDLIIDYNENYELFSQIADESSCIILDERYAIVYVPLMGSANNAYFRFGYNFVPQCTGLMDLEDWNPKKSNQKSSDYIYSPCIYTTKNSVVRDLTGDGVLIGIIDTGVDYTNPHLRNPNGTSRIFSIWDQSIDSGNYPEGYYYGTEYRKEEINIALNQSDPFSFVPTKDTIGHGTILATLAGGSPSFMESTNLSGSATRSDFVVVKLKEAKENIRNLLKIPSNKPCYQSNDIMFAVRYLKDVASQLQRPIVICIGVSTSQGSNEGLSSLDSYISRLALESGRIFVVPGGNEGYHGHHYVGTSDISAGYDDFSLNVGMGEAGLSFEFWGTAPNLYSIDIYAPDDSYLGTIPIILEGRFFHSFIYGNTNLYVDNIVGGTFSGAQLTIFRFENPASGIWNFRVNCSCDIPSIYDVWLPIQNFLVGDTYLLDGNPLNTLTGTANAETPIAITAYDPSNNKLYEDASKGFPRSHSIKPDVAAPGVNILASTTNNQIISVSGTSVATAIATGTVALILEWGIVQGNLPSLNTNNMRNILNVGATRDENLEYPNPYWGYGKLNIDSSLQFAETLMVAL